MAGKDRRKFSLEKATVVARQAPERIQPPGLRMCRNLILSRSDLAPTMRPDITTMGWAVASWSDDWERSDDLGEYIAGFYEMAESGAQIYITNLRALSGSPEAAVIVSGVYEEGTAEVTDGLQLVMGTDTEWFKKVWPGCWMKWASADTLYRVASVPGDGELYLESPAIVAGSGAYTIFRTHHLDAMWWPVRFHQFGAKILYASTMPVTVDPEAICGPFAADLETSWIDGNESDFWAPLEEIASNVPAPRLLAIACWDPDNPVVQGDVWWSLEDGLLYSSEVVSQVVSTVSTERVSEFEVDVVGLRVAAGVLYAYTRDRRAASATIAVPLVWTVFDTGVYGSLPDGAIIRKLRGDVRITDSAWVIIGTTAEDTGLGSAVTSVCVGSAVHVAVSSNGGIATRSSGGVWTSRSVVNTQQFTDVCYMTGIATLVAVTIGGHAWTSIDDGVNWIDAGDVFSSESVFRIEADSAGRSCLAASNLSAWISEDGAAWTLIETQSMAGCVEVCWDGASSVFRVILGSGGSVPVYTEVTVATQFDLGTPTIETDIDYNSTGGERGAYDIIDDGSVLLLGGSRSLMRSATPDGTWVEVLDTGYTRIEIRQIAFSGADYVAVGEYGRLYSSPDGITWTQRRSQSTSDHSENWTGVAWRSSDSKFVAVGVDGSLPNTGPLVSTSTGATGTSWVTDTYPFGDDVYDAIWCISDDGLYIGRASGKFYEWSGAAWVLMKAFGGRILSIQVAPEQPDGVKRLVIDVHDGFSPRLWNTVTELEEQVAAATATRTTTTGYYGCKNGIKEIDDKLVSVYNLGQGGSSITVSISADGGVLWSEFVGREALVPVGQALAFGEVASSLYRFMPTGICRGVHGTGSFSVFVTTDIGILGAQWENIIRVDFPAPVLVDDTIGVQYLGKLIPWNPQAFKIDPQCGEGRETLVGMSDGYITVLDDSCTFDRIVDTGIDDDIHDTARHVVVADGTGGGQPIELNLRMAIGYSGEDLVWSEENADGVVSDVWVVESLGLVFDVTNLVAQNVFGLHVEDTSASGLGVGQNDDSVMVLSTAEPTLLRIKFMGSTLEPNGLGFWNWEVVDFDSILEMDNGLWDAFVWDFTSPVSQGIIVVGDHRLIAKWEESVDIEVSGEFRVITGGGTSSVNYHAIAGTESVFVIVGLGTVLYSVDEGEHWSIADVPYADYRDVVWDGERWIVTSPDGTTLTSTDGITWDETSGTAICNMAVGETVIAVSCSGSLYVVGPGGTPGYTKFNENFLPISDIYRANALVVIQGQLLLAPMLEWTETTSEDEVTTLSWKYHPRRVRRTAFGTYDVFENEVEVEDPGPGQAPILYYAGAGFMDLPGTGEIWDVVVAGQEVIVVESDRFAVLSPTGSSTVPYSYTVTAEGLWPASNLVVVNRTAFFVGMDGLMYQIQGARQVTRLGTAFDLTPGTDHEITKPVALDWDAQTQMLVVFVPGETVVHFVDDGLGTYTTLDLPDVTIGAVAYEARSVVAAKSVDNASVMISYVPADGSSHTVMVAAQFGYGLAIEGADEVEDGSPSKWISELRTGRVRVSEPGVQAEISEVVVKTWANGVNRPIVGVQIRTTEDEDWHSVVCPGTLTYDINDTPVGTGDGTALSHKVSTPASTATVFTLPCPARKARLYLEDAGVKTLLTAWTGSKYTATLDSAKPAGQQLWCFWYGEPQQVGSVGDIAECESESEFHLIDQIDHSTAFDLDWTPAANPVDSELTLIPGQEMPSGDGVLIFGLPREIDDMEIRVVVYGQTGSTTTQAKLRELEVVFLATGEERTDDSNNDGG